MMKRRVMVVGPSGCGKTTLVNAINGSERPLRKTQDVIYGEKTIDVPGAYIENPSMYSHIISTAQTASHVLMLVDQRSSADVFPPGFAKAFTCPVIGVITKAGIMSENADLCYRRLKRMGIEEPYFEVSVLEGVGVDRLIKYLFGKQDAVG